MAFFLLGRAEDGTLSLLSDQAFDSRQDAVHELGAMTADPTFDRWEDDVRVIDFETGAQVLLMRPTPPHTEPAPQVEAAQPEPAAFAALADEVPVAEGAPAETQAPVVDEPTDAPAEDAADTPVNPDEPAEPQADSSPAQTAIESSDEVADEEALESESPVDLVEESSEPETAEAVAGAIAADTLREAIARTTEHMEASGIVAPDSIGPAPTADESSDSAVVVSDDGAGVDEPLADETESVQAEPAAPEAESLAPAEPTVPAWPWATPAGNPSASSAAEIDVSFLLEGLEEPSVGDEGSLIAATMDDEALSASRPVILGAYDDTPAPQAAVAAQDASELAAETDSEPTPPGEDSDFIVLDPIPAVSVPDPVEHPAPVGAKTLSPEKPVPARPDGEDVLSLAAYTCADCVYVDTCPNKDQRRPEDCGSFQWK